MAPLPLAHEKWFVDDPGAFGADWDFALAPPSLSLIALVAAVALAWHLVGGRLPRPELPFLEPLGRLVPWIPRLLGIHLGVSLLSLAVQNAYLAPNLSLDHIAGGAAVAFAEGLLGVWFITGAWLRPAGLVTLLLGPLAALLAGPVAMLEAIDLLGIALFLVVLPPGRDRLGAVERPPEVTALAIFACGSAPGSPWWCWRSARSSPTRPWPASSSPTTRPSTCSRPSGSPWERTPSSAWPRPSSLGWTSARRRDSTGLSTRPS
jgi:hypothetical protein